MRRSEERGVSIRSRRLSQTEGGESRGSVSLPSPSTRERDAQASLTPDSLPASPRAKSFDLGVESTVGSRKVVSEETSYSMHLWLLRVFGSEVPPHYCSMLGSTSDLSWSSESCQPR